MDSLVDLYTRHAALSLEKQLALGAVIGTRNFSFDAEAGTLSFGAELQFPMQLLGTVSRQSNTWLWAWASPQPARPALLQAAQQLRALGERADIEELADEGFDLVTPALAGQGATGEDDEDYDDDDGEEDDDPGEEDDENEYDDFDPDYQDEPLDGHYMAMVAAGVCQADAYYGADYGRGIAYVLLPQVPAAAAQLSDEPARLAAVFVQLLQLPYLLDHREALLAYLQQKGYAVEQRDAQVRGQKNGRTLAATFDSAGRLSALEADGAPVAV